MCCALGKGLLGSGLEVQAVQAQGAGELGLFLGLMPVPLCFSVSSAEVVSHISRELSQSLLVSKQQSSFSESRSEFSVLRQRKGGISEGVLRTPEVGWAVNTCNEPDVPKQVVGNTAEET